uniref:Uncharacterized protein n=1 Tax=Leersia perrieri TaxID=77586 RepID=A0A0D9XED5_9ORYZ
MTKSARSKKNSSCQLRSHYQRPFGQCHFKRVANQESTLAATEKYAWKDAICPVCLECPHNAVLLLSSKDCEDLDSIELTCPLCRGEVKGYTLVEPAREQLNQNKRSCMQDGCSYIGSYGQLCKHVRKKHPSVQPRSVDPMEAAFISEFTARYDLCNEFINGEKGFECYFEELMSSVWTEGDHVATNQSVLQMDEVNWADQ